MQHKRNQTIALIISFILLLSTLSCAELDSHSSISRFKKSEDLYKASLRWGEWNNVFQLQKSKPDSNTTAFALLSEDYLTYLATIDVTHIETLTSAMNKDRKTGKSLFLLEYHFENSARIQKVRHRVDWWHNETNNTWYTNTPLPKEFDLPSDWQKRQTIKLSPKNQY